MKTSTIACLFVACFVVSEAAPAKIIENSEHIHPQVKRIKRSHYGAPAYPAPLYSSPCVAPAPYHLNLGPALHGPNAAYGLSGHGLPGGLGYGGAYGLPHYRSDDFDESETFDMDPSEHVPMMRAYGGYGAPGAGHIGLGAGLGGAGIGPLVSPAGPAIGVFPGGNVRSCDVPLLLSCSPSIASGYLVKNHGDHYVAGSPIASSLPAYRGAELPAPNDAHDEQEHHMEVPSSDHHVPASHENVPSKHH